MSATNNFATQAVARDSPAENAAAITPDDATDLGNVTRGIYVGSAGNLTVQMQGGGGNVTFPNVPAGTTLSIAAKRVLANGTAAANLTGMW